MLGAAVMCSVCIGNYGADSFNSLSPSAAISPIIKSRLFPAFPAVRAFEKCEFNVHFTFN